MVEKSCPKDLFHHLYIIFISTDKLPPHILEGRPSDCINEFLLFIFNKLALQFKIIFWGFPSYLELMQS